MKEILYISGSLLPSKFANSVHVMKMCQAFAKNGVKVRLTAMGGEELNVFNFYDVDEAFSISKTKSTRNNLVRFLKYNWLCFNQIRKSEGVVFLRYFYPLIWCILFRREVVVEMHGVSQSKIINLFLSCIFQYKRLKFAVFITEKLKEEYMRKYNLGASVCQVMADCADDPAVETPNFNTKEIGYVGHLYGGRGIELIIDIAKELCDSNFHIVGGNDEDVEKYKAISPHNIKYYGFVTQKELSSIYQSFSIALAPYQDSVSIGKAGIDTAKWMSPMKVFEYMSYKKVIVLSDLPALREVGEDKEHFVYVKPKDLDGWVNAIKLFQNEPEFVESMSRKSYEKFIECYTWDGRAKKIIELLN